MSQILVAYATKHGATAEIAEAVADELRQAGHDADCVRADDVRDLASYDAVVIGSAVYMKRWRPEARRLLKRNANALTERPFWVFSSGPCGEKPDPSWSEPSGIIKQAERLGARGHRGSAAGCRSSRATSWNGQWSRTARPRTATCATGTKSAPGLVGSRKSSPVPA